MACRRQIPRTPEKQPEHLAVDTGDVDLDITQVGQEQFVLKRHESLIPAVLRIRIRLDPFHFGQPDPDLLQ